MAFSDGTEQKPSTPASVAAVAGVTVNAIMVRLAGGTRTGWADACALGWSVAARPDGERIFAAAHNAALLLVSQLDLPKPRASRRAA